LRSYINNVGILIKSKLKLGFVGVGWIGKHRMEAVVNSNMAEVVWIQDICPELCKKAQAIVPAAKILDFEERWNGRDLDGLVIATPSALHAAQSIQALNEGLAVFCQKPLGRNRQETAEVVEAAQKNDKLLGVDFSYRYTRALQALKQVSDSGELGDIYAVDLVFHNAYGPDKPWYYDPKLSGGGCIIDLGIHLVDLVLWMLNYPELNTVQSNLFSKGRLLAQGADAVEDYAAAQLLFNNKVSVQLSCSWHLPAGCDAVIKAIFYGTQGGISFSNINGSFYDFITEQFKGTSRRVISSGKDDWGGKAAVDWVKKICRNKKFNEEAFRYAEVAGVLDAIYKR
jgi:predicted dehydrogenase